MIRETPISFARGVPALDLVDVDALRTAADSALTRNPAAATAYGDPAGYLPLREYLAAQHGLSPDQVVVTNGSLEGCSLLFDELVRSGTQVVVERPTYDRTLAGLKRRGAELVMVDLDEEGIRVGALRRALDAGATPRFAHVIPTFQNPAGHTLSEARRSELVSLARERDFLVFEDDPYRLTRFAGRDLPTMLSLDPSVVLYASSFSKTVAPGLRVGYLAGPQGIIDRVVSRGFDSYLTPGTFAQSVIYEMCVSGALDRGLETVRLGLRARMHRLAAELRALLPEARFTEPQGGYFLWAGLPSGCDVDRLLKLAEAEGVIAMPGSDFGENPEMPALRLAYAGLSLEAIGEGVARLAGAYRAL